MRVVHFAGFLGVLHVASRLLPRLIAPLVSPLVGTGFWLQLVGQALVALVVLAFALHFVPRLGYRRRDTLWVLVPFVGIFYIVKWSWRLASLPDRYWLASSPWSRPPGPWWKS